MTSGRPTTVVLANGASRPPGLAKPLVLDYRANNGPNIRLALPEFIRNVLHVSARTLDLLEIAAYVYAADRLVGRGRTDAVEYTAWSRNLAFRIRVRDYPFWARADVKGKLTETLEYMTGDASVDFAFEAGHSTGATGLFDSRQSRRISDTNIGAISLFSGGVDSLAGAVELLQSTIGRIVLVSHESRTGTVRTQRALVSALRSRYPGRVLHYRFGCHLQGVRGVEETQRSRSFLYTSIAYAIAEATRVDELLVYENGVTSINLRRREDLGRARTSRTTHPRTMRLLQEFFCLVADRPITIGRPYVGLTKSDVMERLCRSDPDLLSSSVSCTRTYKTSGDATHCGQCLQCVDRRVASIAAEMEDRDHSGLYVHDLVADPITERSARTTAVDYLRQARDLGDWTVARFESEFASELADLLDSVSGGTDAEQVDVIWDLLARHARQVRKAVQRIHASRTNVLEPLPANSLLALVAWGEHTKTEAQRLADAIECILGPAVRTMFRSNKPVDEPDLNTKIAGVLGSHNKDLVSEHPAETFACARVVPDHMLKSAGVIVEAKYIRGGTSPSKANEGIAADLTKYPERAFILFVVFDPQGAIANDEEFRRDIEGKGRNRVAILR